MIQAIAQGLVLGFAASPTCPSNGEEIRLGAQRGFRLALAVGLGAVTGDALVLIAILLGLAPLVQAYPGLNAILWGIGAIVLIYVGVGILRDARCLVMDTNDETADPAASIGLGRGFWAGFAITTFNPFSLVWWIGLLGPWMESSSSAGVAPFALAVLAGQLIWFTTLAGLLHVGHQWLSQRLQFAVLTISGLVVTGYGFYLVTGTLARLNISPF